MFEEIPKKGSLPMAEKDSNNEDSVVKESGKEKGSESSSLPSGNIFVKNQERVLERRRKMSRVAPLSEEEAKLTPLELSEKRLRELKADYDAGRDAGAFSRTAEKIIEKQEADKEAMIRGGRESQKYDKYVGRPHDMIESYINGVKKERKSQKIAEERREIRKARKEGKK